MSNFGVFFEITDLCNHECIHCCKTWRKDSGLTMSKEMIDVILAYPKDYLTISGGEPAMAKEKVFYIYDQGIKNLSINTNLTMWTPEDLSHLQQTVFKVSVPSLIRSEFETITQAKTYDRLVRNLGLIDRSSFIIVIVNNYNINTITQTINRLAYMGFYNITLQPQIPTKFAETDVMLALQRIEDIYRAKRNLNIKLLCKSYDSIVPPNHGCDAGLNRFVVMSNGDVVPCACYAAPVLGNILTTPYEELRRKGREYFSSYEDKITCKGFQQNV